MFDRLNMLINDTELNNIHHARVLIIGIGGVGGYALEMLVRMGVLNITIVDNDVVDLSNLNRQIISLHSNIGMKKVDVAEARIKDINPDVNVTKIDEFITKDNISKLFGTNYDYIIDACDTITTKVLLIKYAQEKDIKIISCMGTGNRFNPSDLMITDIYKTNYDPLAKVMRKLLKENNILHQDVIWSKEIPLKTGNVTPGSTALVPSTAGIYAAYYVINDIIKR